jgi:hypothetical protein
MQLAVGKITRLMLVASVLVGSKCGALGAEAVILVDGRKQLFFDDYLIASKSGVRRTLEQAQKFAGNPVLWPTAASEPALATIYGSVIRDGATYKMWYKSGLGVGYAESEDGVAWNLANNDPIAVGDELRFYYGGRLYRHGPYAGPDKGPEQSGSVSGREPITLRIELKNARLYALWCR